MNKNIEYHSMSKERRIEKLYKQASVSLFGHIKLSHTEQEQLQFLNQAYGITRSKMYSIKRNDLSDAFDHFLRVTYLVLTKSENPTILKTLIAMNHDNLEDTDIDFNGLKNQYGIPDIALGVKIISKNPFCDFIEYSEEKLSDYLIFEKIKEIGILNDKGLLSDNFLSKKQTHNKKYGNNTKNILTIEEYNNLIEKEKEKNIHPKEWKAYKKYKKLEKKYKKIRNETNFENMIDLNTFYNHALNNRNIHKLRISDKKVKQIVLDALEVKYWDRIDNLETSEIYTTYNKKTLKKANRKIKETEKYFYTISKETHPYIFLLIKQEVEKLRAYIIMTEMKYNKDKIMNAFK